jgi:ATP-dependent DNA ligase
MRKRSRPPGSPTLRGGTCVLAATDGERGVHLVYYAFDLLHVGSWDVSSLTLLERKALLEPLVANRPGLQFNGHDTGDGETHPEARRQARL